ncbi:hypothetical protein K435DRAFT_794456 [Dendrothele bispora CBS 962.96]|uniref:CxC1-like cysteine cluster associated with KDZ transposases domain-containing protein n=1 Tax=Dendrothele bispora (strain CBS 962.96) TaxID=1314807 RepID=A0A4S8MBW8_DENBC|nr:hypothetical protein K435DRAFT_794456 [Dendrothele bispora CBS 962.96]
MAPGRGPKPATFRGRPYTTKQKFVAPNASVSGPPIKPKLHRPKAIHNLRAQVAAEELLCRAQQDAQFSSNRQTDDDWMDLGDDYSSLDPQDLRKAQEAAGSILAGQRVVDLSHEGGEAGRLFDVLASRRKKRCIDYQTRRDRVHRRNLAFDIHIEDMTRSYMSWYNKLGEEGMGDVSLESEPDDGWEDVSIRVVDLFTCMQRRVPVLKRSGEILPASLVRQGMFPCSPSRPSVVITARTLEYYRVLYLRCPRLSIQPFVKTLCDIHGFPYQPYLSQQMSICFDLYLNILSHHSAKPENTPADDYGKIITICREYARMHQKCNRWRIMKYFTPYTVNFL